MHDGPSRVGKVIYLQLQHTQGMLTRIQLRKTFQLNIKRGSFTRSAETAEVGDFYHQHGGGFALEQSDCGRDLRDSASGFEEFPGMHPGQPARPRLCGMR